MSEEADGAVTECADQATDGAADRPGTAAAAAVATAAARGAKGEVGVGACAVVFRCHGWIGIGGGGASLAAAAADRLDQHRVGEGALGEVSAVGEHGDGTARAAVASIATHGERGRQVAPTCTGLTAAADAAPTAHGLEQQGDGVDALGAGLGFHNIAGAAQADAAAPTAGTAITATGGGGAEAEVGIAISGAVGIGFASPSTTTTDALHGDGCCVGAPGAHLDVAEGLEAGAAAITAVTTFATETHRR